MRYTVDMISAVDGNFILDAFGMPLHAMKLLAGLGAIVRFDQNKHVLLVPALKGADIVAIFQEEGYDINDPYGLLSSCCEKTVQLKDYQKEDVARYLSQQKIIDASDMGTGKTAKAIFAAKDLLGSKYVICPKSLLLNWKLEIHKFSSDSCVIIINNEHDLGDDNAFYIVSYGWLSSHFDAFDNINPTVVIVDEAHYIKAVDNSGVPSSRRASTTLSFLEKAPYRFLLSGTIAPSRIKDIYNLLVAIDADDVTFNKYFFGFGLEYCDGHQVRFGKKKFWDFNGASNLKQLYAALQPHMIRRLKKDVLPDQTKVRQSIPVKISLKLDPLNDNSSLLKLTDFTRYRKAISEAKVNKTIDFTRTVLEIENKVIICCCFKSSIERIKDSFKDKCIILTGDLSPKERYEAILTFQSDESKNVLAMTIQAGGVGINLTASSTLIFNDFSYVPAEHLQAEDRICRIGQTSDVCNIFYVCAMNNSLDHHAVEILFKKFENANDAIDNGALSYDITKELLDIYAKERKINEKINDR